MSDDNKILNKGLDALLGESQNNQKTVKEINLNKIKPGLYHFFLHTDLKSSKIFFIVCF